ncbi:MAG: recombinase family protein [Methanomassiliicoccales archaeon]|nr:MAG: recombinase family protein [Methanomassiliicoccales archaeon]
MPRVAIYARVSTDDQAKEGYSLDAQQERLKAYCEAQGWDISGIYVDDGHSGRNTKRPAYQRMMEEKDSWDIILVMKMDRIHRNSKNFMIMMENLEKWGKKFTSMNESLDTSNAVGRFVVDIIQRIAQLESEQIGERTYMGMRQKAETSNGLLGFNAPYGYRMEGKKLILDEEECRNVRAIFDMYLSGKRLVDIVRELNSGGIRTKRGKEWTIWSVKRLLNNPIYAGFIRWDGIVSLSDHSPIITVEEYGKVQAMAIARSGKNGTRHVFELPRKAPV